MATATPLLLCNLVYADPDSQAVTVLGVFTIFGATRFPTPARDISGYALLVGESYETGEVVLECRDVLNGELCAKAETRQQLGVLGKRHVHIRLGEVRFPHPGEYEFRLMFDGELAGQQVLLVRGRER